MKLARTVNKTLPVSPVFFAYSPIVRCESLRVGQIAKYSISDRTHNLFYLARSQTVFLRYLYVSLLTLCIVIQPYLTSAALTRYSSRNLKNGGIMDDMFMRIICGSSIFRDSNFTGTCFDCQPSISHLKLW